MKRATLNAVGCFLLALLFSWAAPLLLGGGWPGFRFVLGVECMLAALVAFLFAAVWLDERRDGR